MPASYARLLACLLLGLQACSPAEGLPGAASPLPPLSVTADFDRDGLGDLASAVGAVLQVRIGRHPSHDLLRLRHPATRGHIIGVAASDIDADGDLDLVALRSSGRLIVCRNDAGAFEVVTPRAGVPEWTAGRPSVSASGTADDGSPLDSADPEAAADRGLPRDLPDLVRAWRHRASSELCWDGPAARPGSPRSPPFLQFT